MRAALSALAGLAVIAASGVAAAGPLPDTSSPLSPPSSLADGDVEFELVDLLTEPASINLVEGHPIRVADDDLWNLPALLAEGTDGEFAEQVMASIETRFPDGPDAGSAMLVGLVHQGCFPADDVRVVAQPVGTVALLAEPSDQEGSVTCAVALSTVAVVVVDATDAPPGSADQADLVAFEALGTGTPSNVTGIELLDDDTLDALTALMPDGAEVPQVDLPPLAAGNRRLAFVRSGCGETTAELQVTRATIDTTLEYAPDDIIYDCAVAAYFLAVFDTPADEIPQSAQLAAT